MKKLVIVGGGGAGLTAALAAKKTASDLDITIIGCEEFSYSPCALPFVLGKEIDGFDKIATRFSDICKANKITFIQEEAVSIDEKKKTLRTKSREVPFDSLIISTGGYAVIPPIKGANLQNIYTLYRISDVEKINNAVKGAKTAVVVGGGAIGIEGAAALKHLGLKVTLVEGLEYVLCRFFGTDFLDVIENKIKSEGIDIVKGKNIEEILGDKKVRAVRVAGTEIPADLVIMATGVRSSIKLVEGTGIEVAGAIKVDERLETNIKGIYAAGDCSVTKSPLTGKYTPSLLGTTAVREGNIAGINAAGGNAIFEGVLNAMVVKIFDLEVGRVGFTEKDAAAEGIEVVVGKAKTFTKAEYFPGAKPIEVKLLFNAANEQLIGAEVIGEGGVVGKIDVLALAVSKKLSVGELTKLEYCYTPPLAPSHNGIVQAAENAHRKIMRLKERAKRTS
jgi:NADH oxidase (H2O2-forming)